MISEVGNAKGVCSGNLASIGVDRGKYGRREMCIGRNMWIVSLQY